MLIDFRKPSSWTKLNEQAAEILKIDLAKNGLRFFHNTSHAIVEVTQGLTKQFPLKKKVFYFKNMSVNFEPALAHLAKDGYQLVALDLSILKSVDELKPQFDRETLCVLYSVDEPILGAQHPTQSLEDLLLAASVPRVRVSHAQHYQSEFLNLADRNEVRIFACGLHTSKCAAIAHMGERLRVGSVAAPELNWSGDEFTEKNTLATLNELLNFKTNASKLAEKIKSFEAKKVADSSALTVSITGTALNRIYDRALLCWQDMDGTAVIEAWSNALDFQLVSPGLEGRLETTSLSRWGGVRTFDFLEVYGLTPNQRRGLVIVSGRLFEAFEPSVLEKTLIQVRQSILEAQNGH